MDNSEFQKLVLDSFKEINDNFKNVDNNLKEIREKLIEHDQQFIDIKALSSQHHEELEKVATQVENLVVGQESLQDDMDYLLRRSLRKKI
ncbi:MAG TPA: hypothetical protein VIM70_14230 [Clostridium sp.]|uniref:hypothetical protein n=1 Tax=Clostridium sp. TaxID=1506 RepID=UPI002F950E53